MPGSVTQGTVISLLIGPPLGYLGASHNLFMQHRKWRHRAEKGKGIKGMLQKKTKPVIKANSCKQGKLVYYTFSMQLSKGCKYSEYTKE